MLNGQDLVPVRPDFDDLSGVRHRPLEHILEQGRVPHLILNVDVDLRLSWRLDASFSKGSQFTLPQFVQKFFCRPARGLYQVGDNCYGIRAGFERCAAICAGDAADRYQRFTSEGTGGTDTGNSDHGIGIGFGPGCEDRTYSQVVR